MSGRSLGVDSPLQVTPDRENSYDYCNCAAIDAVASGHVGKGRHPRGCRNNRPLRHPLNRCHHRTIATTVSAPGGRRPDRGKCAVVAGTQNVPPSLRPWQTALTTAAMAVSQGDDARRNSRGDGAISASPVTSQLLAICPAVPGTMCRAPIDSSKLAACENCASTSASSRRLRVST